jgi:hypothetical protein
MNGTGNHRSLTTKDLFLKDAFLVFRAMCKLTMKPLNAERFAVDILPFFVTLIDRLFSANAT